MLKKQLLLFSLLLPFIALSQTIQFSKAVSMDVQEISLVPVAKIGSRFYGANTGYKYLVIKGELKSIVKKRMEVPLYKLLLKSNDSTFMALADVSYIPFSEKDRFLRVKKKADKKIYFEVPETFTQGLIGYDRELIGDIKMNEDGLTATLKLAEEDSN